jgi:hypothetical protein
MAKIVGFNADIAHEQEAIKRTNQRKQAHKKATANIHMTKNNSPLTHKLPL